MIGLRKKGPDIILRCINKCLMRRIDEKVRREVKDETISYAHSNLHDFSPAEPAAVLPFGR